MRVSLAVLCIVISTPFAFAQQTPAPGPAPNQASQGEPTGNPAIPNKKEQPQGNTGQLETEGNGARPENPQGGTPEGMQVHPIEPK